MLAGSYQMVGEEKYYTNDFVKFYIDAEMTQELSENDLKDWAEWLNDPWSQTHEKWTIECNCIDPYTSVKVNEPTFRCIYEVVGMDCITSKIIGYGHTQQEALKECIAHFDFLQEKYNEDVLKF